MFSLTYNHHEQREADKKKSKEVKSYFSPLPRKSNYTGEVRIICLSILFVYLLFVRIISFKILLVFYN